MADGKTRQTVTADIVAGNILRSVNQDGTSPPFPDSLITKVENGTVWLQRPQVFYVSGPHSEVYSTSIEMAVGSKLYVTVLSDRGEPYKM